MKIAVQLPIGAYYSLSRVCRRTFRLLQDAYVKKEWLVRYMDGNVSDALVMTYRQKLDDVTAALLRTTPHYHQHYHDQRRSPHSHHSHFNHHQPFINTTTPTTTYHTRIEDAFPQITCHEVGPDDIQGQARKLDVLRSLLQRLDHHQPRSGDGDPGNAGSTAPLPPPPPLVSARELAVMALRWSAYFAEHLIVEYLLEDYGLHVNTIQCYETWWKRMLRDGRLQLIQLLLKHGARISPDGHTVVALPDDEEEEEEEVEVEGAPGAAPTITPTITPTTTTTPTVNRGHHRRRYYRDYFPRTLEESVLLEMAREGHVDAVRVLLEHTPAFQTTTTGEDDDNSNDDTDDYNNNNSRKEGEAHYGALMTACDHGQWEVVRYLVEGEWRWRSQQHHQQRNHQHRHRHHHHEHHSHSQSHHQPDYVEWEGLFLAARRGHEQVVRVLWPLLVPSVGGDHHNSDNHYINSDNHNNNSDDHQRYGRRLARAILRVAVEHGHVSTVAYMLSALDQGSRDRLLSCRRWKEEAQKEKEAQKEEEACCLLCVACRPLQPLQLQPPHDPSNSNSSEEMVRLLLRMGAQVDGTCCGNCPSCQDSGGDHNHHEDPRQTHGSVAAAARSPSSSSRWSQLASKCRDLLLARKVQAKSRL